MSDTKPSPTIERACVFLDRVKALLIEKNRRYGDSAANPLRIFSKAGPTEQVRVRIDDKISRLARGAGMDRVDGEDVLLDLVGYLAILAALEDGT